MNITYEYNHEKVVFLSKKKTKETNFVDRDRDRDRDRFMIGLKKS